MKSIAQLRIRSGVLAVAATLAGAVSAAHANFSDPILTFSASNAQGSGSFSVSLADAQFNNGEIVVWNLVGGINIMDGANTIGSVNTAQLTLQTFTPASSQALVALSFNVTGGLADTEFTITSSLVDAFLIQNAQARATGTFSVTDGNLNGATLTGLHAGGGLYNAMYNGGSSFTELFTSGPYNVGVSGSTGGAEDVPFGPGNFSPLGVDVDDIQAQWHFRITAGDQAAGTSNFIVMIPAPGGLALLAVGGLAATRRRR
ncbi:MAG: hypothetical protein R3B57_07910 [Phycisphaerales bacterium]